MIIHDKLHKLAKNDIKIYPVNRNFNFAVCIEDNRNVVFKRKKTIGEYKHSTKTINKALIKSVDYVFDKICRKTD